MASERRRNVFRNIMFPPTIVPLLTVLLLSVILRVGVVSGSLPSYNNNQSGTSKQTSIQKERIVTDDEDLGGVPAVKYSGTKNKGHRAIMPTYQKPSSTFSSSVNGYYPVSADPYYEDYYERPGRHFSARSVSPSSYPMMAVAASQVGFADSDYSASHDHGWGWGWGHGASKIDNSSLGLLGLLGLLSLLSNVLTLLAATASTTANGRRKRSAAEDAFNTLLLDDENKVEQICQNILPSLNVIGNIQNKVIPSNCSHQEVCKANQILVAEFGTQGRRAGSMLSSAILKMLKEIDHSPSLDKHLLRASLGGRNGEDCEIVFPTCTPLKKDGKAGLPQLISPEHVTAIVHGRNPRLFPLNSRTN